jgi:filamin
MNNLYFSGFSFTPEEVGQHEVSVRKSGNHIQNSPFKIYIEKTELGRGHANKVKVHGDGIVEGVSGVQNEFIIDTREAGIEAESIDIVKGHVIIILCSLSDPIANVVPI